MDEQRARSLVARERRRIETALAELTGEEHAEAASQFDQTGESPEAGGEVQHELVDEALAAALQDELAAVVRAEARIAEGTYGRSVESGSPIPDDRLEAEPLAERTVEEQSEYERSQR
jgi:DnaK suppressor protein